MTIRTPIILFTIMACLTFHNPKVHAGLGDFLKAFEKGLAGDNVSESQVIDGLKQALETGTSNAIESVSKAGGYLNNPRTRIPLPAAVVKVEMILRKAGLGSQVDAFEQSMNRTTELLKKVFGKAR